MTRMKKRDDIPKYEYTARHAAPAPIEDEQSTTTEFPSLGEKPVEVGELLFTPQEEEPMPSSVKKRRGLLGLFGIKRAKQQPILEETVEEAEDVIVEPEEIEPVPDDTREIILRDGEIEKTQVIELAEEGGSHLVEDEATQLMLDGFADETADVEPEPGPEETLRRIRQEKIQDFSQRREQHEREAEQAAESAAEAVVVDPVEETVPEEDETPVQETLVTIPLTEVRQQLLAQHRRSGVTLLLSVVLELILFFIALLSRSDATVAMQPISYLILQVVLFVALMAVCGTHIKGGFVSLFARRRITTEGVVTILSCLTVIHTVLQALNTTGLADGTSPILTGVTGLGLLALQITHRLEINRAGNDLNIMIASGEKLAAKRIDSQTIAEEIGRPAVAMGVPRVAYFRRTEQAENYIADSRTYDPASGFLRWYLPIVTGVSFVVAVLYLILNGVTSGVTAFSLFCGMLVIAIPVPLLFTLYTSLSSVSRKAREQGTAIAGYRAVESFGNVHAVALDAMELFPENSVQLHGIKTFSGTRIDEAILDAASVSIRAGGPLSHVFRRMILGKVDMLHEVDTLVYEQDMGLSGWISGRRVLIGNRRLLDNHGIDIPSRDYEERYAKNGRQLVYLSIAGELSAMFVVSYVADPQVRRVLKSLTDRHITLLIRTCDQNVTEDLVTSVFSLNGFYVELLNAPAGRSFETLVSGTSAAEPAQIVSEKGSPGMMMAFARCRRLRSGVRFFAVLQSLVGLLGSTLTVVAAFSGAALYPALYAMEVVALSAAVSALLGLAFSRN